MHKRSLFQVTFLGFARCVRNLQYYFPPRDRTAFHEAVGDEILEERDVSSCGPEQKTKVETGSCRQTASDGERQKVLDEPNRDRFMDKSSGEVWATQLDEEVHLCCERAMYRILADNQEVKGRCNQLNLPEYTKPELRVEGLNEVWSRDITKLWRPTKWTFFISKRFWIFSAGMLWGGWWPQKRPLAWRKN